MEEDAQDSHGCGLYSPQLAIQWTHPWRISNGNEETKGHCGSQMLVAWLRHKGEHQLHFKKVSNTEKKVCLVLMSYNKHSQILQDLKKSILPIIICAPPPWTSKNEKAVRKFADGHMDSSGPLRKSPLSEKEVNKTINKTVNSKRPQQHITDPCPPHSHKSILVISSSSSSPPSSPEHLPSKQLKPKVKVCINSPHHTHLKLKKKAMREQTIQPEQPIKKRLVDRLKEIVDEDKDSDGNKEPNVEEAQSSDKVQKHSMKFHRGAVEDDDDNYEEIISNNDDEDDDDDTNTSDDKPTLKTVKSTSTILRKSPSKPRSKATTPGRSASNANRTSEDAPSECQSSCLIFLYLFLICLI
jgi:hypothetical protein